MPDFSDPSIQARDPRTPTATAITTILGASRLLKTKMAPTNLSHRQTHNLLLISKLLSLRDTASPLTLLLDTLEQPATPLIREYIRRAKISKVHITLISFETLKSPDGVDAFVSARRKTPAEIIREVATAYQPTQSASPSRRMRYPLVENLIVFPTYTSQDASSSSTPSTRFSTQGEQTLSSAFRHS
jgi:hypothetical protein